MRSFILGDKVSEQEEVVVVVDESARWRAKLSRVLRLLVAVVVWAHQDREGPEKPEKLLRARTRSGVR